MVSRRYLYDGRELNVSTLVELRLLLLQAGIDASIALELVAATLRQATRGLALATRRYAGPRVATGSLRQDARAWPRSLSAVKVVAKVMDLILLGSVLNFVCRAQWEARSYPMARREGTPTQMLFLIVSWWRGSQDGL